MMILGPEFQRNLWLKFSLFRAVSMVVILGLMTFVLIGSGNDWTKPLIYSSLIGFFLTVILWGNFEAASSLRDELKNNTWDFQKMSSIGPWQLSMGKLFGSTSYVWYFGLALLALFCFSYSNFELKLSGHDLRYASRYASDSRLWNYETGSASPDFRELFYVCSFLILSGVMGHATAMYLSLLNMRFKKTDVISPFIGGMVVSASIFNIALASMETAELQQTFFEDVRKLTWFGHHFDSQFFVQCFVLFFLYWLLAGIYRAMREELQFRMTPVVWGIFSISLTIFFIGFIPSDIEMPMIKGGGHEKLLMGSYLAFSYFLLLVLMYVAVFSEATNLAQYKRFFNAVRRARLRAVAENCPKWVVSFFIAFSVYIALVSWISNNVPAEASTRLIFFMTASALFIARDGIVLHAIQLGNPFRHARFMVAVYYLMVYGILPLAVSTLFEGKADINIAKQLANALSSAQGGKAAAFLPYWDYFFPGARETFAQGILPVLFETLLAAGFLFYRLRPVKRDRSKDIPVLE